MQPPIVCQLIELCAEWRPTYTYKHTCTHHKLMPSCVCLSVCVRILAIICLDNINSIDSSNNNLNKAFECCRTAVCCMRHVVRTVVVGCRNVCFDISWRLAARHEKRKQSLSNVSCRKGRSSIEVHWEKY